MKLGALLEMPNGDSPVAWRSEDWTSSAKPGAIATFNIDAEMARRRFEVVEWLNGLFPGLRMLPDASDDELRERLRDGTILSDILKKFSCREFCSEEAENVDYVSDDDERVESIRRFSSAVERMGFPGFKVSDLEQGLNSSVVYCLWSLKDHVKSDLGGEKDANLAAKGTEEARKGLNGHERSQSDTADSLREDVQGAQSTLVSSEERRRSFGDLRIHPAFRSPAMSEPTTPQSHHGGNKSYESFQLRQGRYHYLSAAKVLEMTKSNSLDNAPTQSLLSVAIGILDESIERKNGEITHCVACLLRKVVQEIERRISTQAEHIRNQNNLIKAREEKYQSRIKVLETLANGTSEETQVAKSQIQPLKADKSKTEDRKKFEEDTERFTKEKENSDRIIANLRQDLEATRKSYEEKFESLKSKALQSQIELEEQIKEREILLVESRKRIKELEEASETRCQIWNQKEHIFENFMLAQLHSLQDLRFSSNTIKLELVNAQKQWCEEVSNFGNKLKVLVDAAESYHAVLAENRNLYNEVQELKGNIRVYSRVRPFLEGENPKQTTIEYISENGELVLTNPSKSKQGKDGHKMFKFNKVFGPATTQEEVFLDIQPLVRSVLDGFNVCIFAYGQTGSGKTYTMTGPSSATEKEWGVNYRALSDLFHISHNRRDTIMYEVYVQMVEIYNEQVRDLLATDGSQKKLGILNTSQPDGLAVPDATMLPVTSTSDVLDLMQIGLSNRVVGATALNERSSRSHSIVIIHVRGTDLKTGDYLRGSLHLVDLAGSERVDRSEVTGDRLKEAQHINKSLSALGDVIFSLSQKSVHVPYRNSKLTQLLQSSLGGHAKTLMFVQINPDVGSYSETLSTLKFAERVAGVELGAAKSQKEGKDIRDLTEQVASLRDTLARKDEEIEHLQQINDIKSSSLKFERHNSNSMKHSYSLPASISMLRGAAKQDRMTTNGSITSKYKSSSDSENCSEFIAEYSECGSQMSTDDHKHQNEIIDQQKLTRSIPGQNSGDLELLSFGDADSDERLSDISDGVLSMGAETDGSIGSVVEFSLFPEQGKSSPIKKNIKNKVPARVPKPPLQKAGQPVSATRPKSKDITRLPSTRKVATSQAVTVPSSKVLASRRWQ